MQKASLTRRRGAAPSKRTRALVPVYGYYEWKTDPTMKKKTPFYIHSPNDELLAFAGLYSWWKDHSKADDAPTPLDAYCHDPNLECSRRAPAHSRSEPSPTASGLVGRQAEPRADR